MCIRDSVVRLRCRTQRQPVLSRGLATQHGGDSRRSSEAEFPITTVDWSTHSKSRFLAFGFTLMRLSTDIHKISGSIAVNSGHSRRSPIGGPALWLTCRIGVRLADHRGVAGSQTVCASFLSPPGTSGLCLRAFLPSFTAGVASCSDFYLVQGFCACWRCPGYHSNCRPSRPRQRPSR
mgnify:CR=1 FL=1